MGAGEVREPRGGQEGELEMGDEKEPGGGRRRPYAFANTLDKNITFNSKFDGKTIPVSRNDGVPAKMASEAHQDFEAKDFRASPSKNKRGK
ncbi:hypothetical protein TrLO_g2691 [Triparma laevis f. longispina]|uniref:Uncharacterized protein n=1 Tax=Triparma laevis f. longispina TaxID=1714387 RepID=A0A9W7DQT6_9STRA|nr:hypothetical protein TrLO_g2691 [Triparma laevis f. longispina]